MSYKTIFGDVFEDEHDEEMSRKHGYNYQTLKHFYPDAYKLPSDEIKSMIGKLYEGPANEKEEDMQNRLKSYIRENESRWKNDYFSNRGQPEQDWANYNLNQNLNRADYGEDPYKNTFLEFDGENLKWMNDGKIIRSWRGMSGKPEYQNKASQWMPAKGPLPEGTYQVRQKNAQAFEDLPLNEQAISYLGGITKNFGYPAGKWPGGKFSWGNNRVWLEPDEDTNTYGRDNFSIHGGTSLGSSGCIDLTGQGEDFANEFYKYGRDIPLKVKYPNYTWWENR